MEKFILPVMCLVGCTFIANMGILFGSCRPYTRMWVFYEDEGGKLTIHFELGKKHLILLSIVFY